MRWLQLDLIDKAALGIILLLVILVLGSPYLATNRRQLALLIGTAICLGVGGYVVFDRLYLELNLRLTNARQIREECAKLLQQAPRQRMGNLVCPAVYALRSTVSLSNRDTLGIATSTSTASEENENRRVAKVR